MSREIGSLPPPPLQQRQNSIRTRDDVDPQIRTAAEGMEAMFLDYMMRSMRKTVPKNEMSMENQATEIYRGMLDTEIAERAAKNAYHGIGLADQIIAYLEARSYNQESGKTQDGLSSKRSTVSTGGTSHADQPQRESKHSVHPERSK